MARGARWPGALALGLAAAGCCRWSAPPPGPASCAGATAPAPPPSPAAVEVSAAGAAAAVPREVVRQVNHRIEFGPYAVEVDATLGGRIVDFTLGGRSVVVPREESPEAFGSSIWPSPQRAWSWPPPPAFDGQPWAARVEGGALVLESGTDPKLGLAARQRLEADVAREALRLDVTLENRGSEPRRVAPWQNTRVRPRGLTFFPSPDPAYPISTLKLAPQAGITWFQHDPARYTESVKLYADGEEGWIAQVDGRHLFVKVFPDVPRERQAPAEGEVVIYVHGGGGFVEVEQQGSYDELAPGASSTWTVYWLLRELPSELVVEAGNAALVELARDLAASVRT